MVVRRRQTIAAVVLGKRRQSSRSRPADGPSDSALRTTTATATAERDFQDALPEQIEAVIVTYEKIKGGIEFEFEPADFA